MKEHNQWVLIGHAGRYLSTGQECLPVLQALQVGDFPSVKDPLYNEAFIKLLKHITDGRITTIGICNFAQIYEPEQASENIKDSHLPFRWPEADAALKHLHNEFNGFISGTDYAKLESVNVVDDTISHVRLPQNSLQYSNFVPPASFSIRYQDMECIAQEVCISLSDLEQVLRQGDLNTCDPTDGWSTKEIISAKKLIYIMASSKYNFDPTKSKNDATSKIESDGQLLGLSINQDTIRKFLKQAAELNTEKRQNRFRSNKHDFV